MLGEPEIVTINGVEHKIEGFTKFITDSFEQHMRNSYLELIKKNKEELGDDYLDLLKKHFFDIKKGLLDFGGDQFYQFINCEDNFITLMHWLFVKYPPGILKTDLKKWMEDEPELSIGLFERLMNATKKN